LDPVDFLDLEALFLGFPIPSLLSSLPSSDISLHGALGDRQFSSSTHAGHTRKQSHDRLARLLADFARRVGFSGVQTAFSRIPVAGRADHPESRGDIFFPSGLSPADPRRPFVLDVRMSHVFTGAGNLRPSLFTTVSREKNRRYKDAYYDRGITFAPLPVSTFLGVGPEVCHLLYRLANFSPDSPSSSAPPSDSQSAITARSVCFSRLLKEFQFAVALASLERLRGRDGFIPVDACAPSSTRSLPFL
jgi:hypothetical protein